MALRISLPDVGSKTVAVFPLPMATARPSALNATASTVSFRTTRERSFPLAASNTRAVRSNPLVAIQSPSPLNAKTLTAPS